MKDINYEIRIVEKFENNSWKRVRMSELKTHDKFRLDWDDSEIWIATSDGMSVNGPELASITARPLTETVNGREMFGLYDLTTARESGKEDAHNNNKLYPHCSYPPGSYPAKIYWDAYDKEKIELEKMNKKSKKSLFKKLKGLFKK